jgi:hypothetical protein
LEAEMAMPRVTHGPLTVERLRELLHYDPETGDFTWRQDRVAGAKAGDRAGWLANSGYITLRVERKQYLAHRLAWLYVTGEWPPQQVDHVNQNKVDNRWANLRAASHGQNVINRSYRRPKHNLPRGVRPAYGGRFEAWIGSKVNRRFLGSFDTADEAHAAYLQEARRVYGEFLPK